MPSKIYSATNIGLEAKIVEVETDVSSGLNNFAIVGLPDKAIEESKERITAAIKSSQFEPPLRRSRKIIINLAPADIKKEGCLFDLPMALGYLLETKQIKFNPEEKIFIGELGLNGILRPVRGALSFALLAAEKGLKEIILPQANAAEAALIKNPKTKVIGAENLKNVIDYLIGKTKIKPTEPSKNGETKPADFSFNFSWIKGQEFAKRALEIAASGGHNLLMEGPPGTGKSLLAKAFVSILPELSFEESLEVSKIYSVAGLLSKENPLIKTRPFRAPHHSASEAALIGGGNPPRPGEITLAHRGVLFLDEFPEFHRDVLESLRQPLEEGEISILRAKTFCRFPSRFILIAAANPCPCGYFGSFQTNKECICSRSQINSYRKKLSGPLIDRIDILINVPPIKFEKASQEKEESESEKIKEKVKKARKIQKQRFNSNLLTNSEMNIPQIKKFCQINDDSKAMLRHYLNSGEISMRGYHKILKIARTIADLDNSEKIKHRHISEAAIYRIKENRV